jgi:hypothetical protein
MRNFQACTGMSDVVLLTWLSYTAKFTAAAN